jgi:hypothetical protein
MVTHNTVMQNNIRAVLKAFISCSKDFKKIITVDLDF